MQYIRTKHAMAKIDILPLEMMGLIGKFVSFDDRRNMILAHPCFSQANTEYVYHCWTIDKSLFLSYNPSLKQKFDCLKEKKPKLKKMVIMMKGNAIANGYNDSIDLIDSIDSIDATKIKQCAQDIIHISSHVALKFCILVTNSEAIFELNCIFRAFQMVDTNQRIEILLHIGDIRLLNDVYSLLKEYNNVPISHIKIDVDTQYTTIHQCRSFTSLLDQSFKNNIKLVEYPYCMGISPTSPPLHSQQIIVIDKSSIGHFLSSFNPPLWDFLLQYAQSVKCIKWKEIFTNCVMLKNYVSDLQNLKNIGKEFMISSNIVHFVNVFYSDCMNDFVSMLYDQELTLVFENCIFDPNIIGFIKIIEREFNKRNKQCTFKINVMKEMDLNIAYLIYIRLIMTHPSIQLYIIHNNTLCKAEQKKIMNTPKEELHQLYESYKSNLSRLDNHPFDIIVWE